ncbi:MAG: hypothetical protein ACREHG_04515, partial [Candidatus Saccharimonadales bacterium]
IIPPIDMSATKIVSTRKVNNLKVRRIPLPGEEDKRPIKGYELCCHLYANIYLCAKKNSGKTTVIYNIIDRCAGRDTTVIAFVSTLHNDANWGAIQKMCEDKGVPFIGYTSLVDEEGVDQLQALVKSLQDKAGDEKMLTEVGSMPTEETKRSPLPCISLTPEPEPESEKKPRKTPYRAPEYIIVLDDLADELKKKSVATLLKKNRHFKCKVIISSQWLNDLPPSGLGQMNMVCLFRGFSVEKLGEFHSKARLAMPLEKFIDLYKDATAEDYGFLYIDMDNNVYRKKFDRAYD